MLKRIGCVIITLVLAVPIYDFTNLYVYQPQHKGENRDPVWPKYYHQMCSDIIISGIGVFWKPYLISTNDPSCLVI